jgi:hypothetical protein
MKGMAFAMEENVPPNPRKVLLFGTVGVVFAAEDRAGPSEVTKSQNNPIQRIYTPAFPHNTVSWTKSGQFAQ